jgi:hypothetical protein
MLYWSCELWILFFLALIYLHYYSFRMKIPLHMYSFFVEIQYMVIHLPDIINLF